MKNKIRNAYETANCRNLVANHFAKKADRLIAKSQVKRLSQDELAELREAQVKVDTFRDMANRLMFRAAICGPGYTEVR